MYITKRAVHKVRHARGVPKCVMYFWGVPGCVTKCDKEEGGVKIGQK